MRARVDPLGKLLVRTGALTEDMLADVLEQQQCTLPLGSLCYILGHLDEETLVRALARQFGVPGVVLDRSVIRLDVLTGLSQEAARQHRLLPIYEDERRIFVAAEDPRAVASVLRELQFVRGKAIMLHVALHVTLARTLRACYAAKERGQTFHAGPLASPTSADDRGVMVVVSDTGPIAEAVRVSPVHEAAVEEVTKELDSVDLMGFEVTEDESGLYVDTQIDAGDELARGPRRGALRPLPRSARARVAHASPSPELDLDEGEGADYQAGHGGPGRVLIVDDDFATRHLLVKLLQPLGIITATAMTGAEAVLQLKTCPPDIVIIDVMLPEIDGFQICRAIKRSHKYNHIAVILMSAMLDSGRVTDEVLRSYGADAYFEKPLALERMEQHVRELLRATGPGAPASEDDSFQRAVALYKVGDIDNAIEILRRGLEVDPLSAKHHFVLANLLQKKSLIYEAIDEYEATLELRPDYFPALTRLAYLYYKNGFSAKAVETWRRSLSYCTDPNLRQNIEAFMRKVIASMQSHA